MEQHRNNYFYDYADPWGDMSLDQDLFEEGGGTLGGFLSRGLWD
jgi:hypothetical protein